MFCTRRRASLSSHLARCSSERAVRVGIGSKRLSMSPSLSLDFFWTCRAMDNYIGRVVLVGPPTPQTPTCARRPLEDVCTPATRLTTPPPPCSPLPPPPPTHTYQEQPPDHLPSLMLNLTTYNFHGDQNSAWAANSDALLPPPRRPRRRIPLRCPPGPRRLRQVRRLQPTCALALAVAGVALAVITGGCVIVPPPGRHPPPPPGRHAAAAHSPHTHAPLRPPNPELLRLHTKLSSEMTLLGHTLALSTPSASAPTRPTSLRTRRRRASERNVVDLRAESTPEVDELVCPTTSIVPDRFRGRPRAPPPRAEVVHASRVAVCAIRTVPVAGTAVRRRGERVIAPDHIALHTPQRRQWYAVGSCKGAHRPPHMHNEHDLVQDYGAFRVSGPERVGAVAVHGDGGQDTLKRTTGCFRVGGPERVGAARARSYLRGGAFTATAAPATCLVAPDPSTLLPLYAGALAGLVAVPASSLSCTMHVP
ncbi:hypothetical protein FB451DRAFT_1558333 [Mycena latifolia]|nr:hypothetical protein FB451DRAFT_1558333 [Mycena latifolia]